MRRKEYAVSLGLATAGRGRMSREALDAIEKARAGGMTFDDDAPAPVKREKTVKVTEKRPVSVKTHTRETDGVMADTTMRYPMDQMFKGVDSNGKTHVVSGRNACTCGYSLVGHVCNTPTALIGSPLERISVTPV